MNEHKTQPPRVNALKKSTGDLIERINKRLQADSWYHSTQVGMLEIADMMLNAVNEIYTACGKAECSAAFAPEIANERFTATEKIKRPPRSQALINSTQQLQQQVYKRLNTAMNSKTKQAMLQVAEILRDINNQIHRVCGKVNCAVVLSPEVTHERFTALENTIMESSKQRAEPAPEATCKEPVDSDIIITKSVYHQNNIPVDEPIDIHEEIAETSMEEIFGNRRIL